MLLQAFEEGPNRLDMRYRIGIGPPFHFVWFSTFCLAPRHDGGCGRALTLVSLVIAPAFSFNSPIFVSPPPATLAVRGKFLTVVCLIIAPSSSRSPRHAGSMREVFGGGLPYYSVCVSFNEFSLRFSCLHSQAVQRCGSGY